MERKYRIFFDTNIVWRDKVSSEIFAGALADLCEFIREHSLALRVDLVVPEVVIKERTAQIVSDVFQRLETMATRAEELSKVGIRVSVPKVRRVGLTKRLERSGRDFLEKHHVHLAKTTVTGAELLRRALDRKKPFGESSDKGLKDTLIWIALLRDAQKNKNIHYIFLTGNSTDFVQDKMGEEFLAKCGSERSFKIMPDTNAVKVFFDQELNLDLNLKEMHRKVKDIVKSNIPSIIEAINKASFSQISHGGHGAYGFDAEDYIFKSHAVTTRGYNTFTGDRYEALDAVLGYRLLEDANGILTYDENPKVIEINQAQDNEDMFNVEINIRALPITTADVRPKNTASDPWGAGLYGVNQSVVNTMSFSHNDSYMYTGHGYGVSTIKAPTSFSMTAIVNVKDESFNIIFTHQGR